MAQYDDTENSGYSEIKSPEGEARIATLQAIAQEVAQVSSKLIMVELRKALDAPEIKENIGKGMMLYLYAAGFLSFAGREITRTKVGAVVKSTGVEPNYELIDLLLKNDMKSHLVYVYAFYYLVASGKDPSKENVKKVLEAIKVKPDMSRADDILEFVSYM
jgi:ribosomal protein L12E/L44/L45/RPP1/RPP2